MQSIRPFLILLALIGLAILTLQNVSPSLPLVFLGFKTQALPLAVWVVGAVAAGVMTTLAITGLLGLSNQTARPFARPDARATSRRSNTNTRFRPTTDTEQNTEQTSMPDLDWVSQSQNPASATKAAVEANPTANQNPRDWGETRNSLEDWEDWEGYENLEKTAVDPAEPRVDVSAAKRPTTDHESLEEWDDWDDEEDLEAPISAAADRRDVVSRDVGSRDISSGIDEDHAIDDPTPADPPQTDYEVEQEPIASYRSGSLYSYSYQKPSDSGAGMPEDV
ncbi:MAG: hypothetical protein F6K19_30215, partial [Cyanothece sp. SIO1E1]|nr:hypothetical protein [Cyanothece sp. SIO1E1]